MTLLTFNNCTRTCPHFFFQGRPGKKLKLLLDERTLLVIACAATKKNKASVVTVDRRRNGLVFTYMHACIIKNAHMYKYTY